MRFKADLVCGCSFYAVLARRPCIITPRRKTTTHCEGELYTLRKHLDAEIIRWHARGKCYNCYETFNFSLRLQSVMDLLLGIGNTVKRNLGRRPRVLFSEAVAG